MAPLTGVPLPFISYGSTNLIVLLGGMGLLLNVAATGGWPRARRRPRLRAIDGGRMPKVVIAAGGTAGHVVPALAVADALRDSGAEVEFVGGERAEAELVPAAGLPLPSRCGWPASTAATRCAPRGPSAWRSRRPCRARGGCCARMGADAVLGRGGYVAGPVGLAARSLRLPLVLTEADSHLGFTNRLLAPVRPARLPRLPARRAATASATSVGGRPVPAGTGKADRAAARERFGIGDGRAVPAGVRRLARRAPPQRRDARRLRRRRRRAPCCTPRGRRDHAELAAPPGGAGLACRTTTCTPTSSRSPTRSRRPTWWSARSGGSVFEVAAAGLPSILVPYPHATADHQTLNARYMEEAGAAVVVPDAELDGPRLAREVAALLGAPERMRAMAKAAVETAKPGAASRVADELLQLAG